MFEGRGCHQNRKVGKVLQHNPPKLFSLSASLDLSHSFKPSSPASSSSSSSSGTSPLHRSFQGRPVDALDPFFFGMAWRVVGWVLDGLDRFMGAETFIKFGTFQLENEFPNLFFHPFSHVCQDAAWASARFGSTNNHGENGAKEYCLTTYAYC